MIKSTRAPATNLHLTPHNPPMDAGAWVALYAAVVATGALAWQAATYVLDRRPRLRVEIALIYFLRSAEDTPSIAGETISGDWRLQADILNLGRSTARISDVQFEARGERPGLDVWTSVDWRLPWVLRPGEERQVFLTDDEVGTLTRGRELIARVKTSIGRDFVSETLRVGAEGTGTQLITVPAEGLWRMANAAGLDENDFYIMRVTEFGDEASGGEHHP
jgi:hypothetical protein